MNSIEEIWNGILTLLKGEISQTALDTWFSSAELADLDNNNAVICAANDLAAQVIRERFSGRLKDALNELFCAEYNIVVISGREGKEKYLSQKDGRTGSRPSPIPAYSFEDYIVNDTNRFAYLAARAVATRPGDIRFNPLVIYGGSGLGKTHLLCAIGCAVKNSHPGKRIIYIKGDEFTNHLVRAIKTRKTEQLRETFRNADMLLIDGIESMAGKNATQEEFYNTFNTVFENGGQIAVTAECAPKDMPMLDDRLRSRLEGGILAEIQPADRELRHCFVQTRARAIGLEISRFDIDRISSAPIGSIRQLGGVLNNLSAYKSVLGYVPAENVNRAINAIADSCGMPVNPEKIITETARYYEVSESEICSMSRARIPSRARRIAMYLMRTELKMSSADIGMLFARDNAAVMTSIGKIESKIKSDAETAEAVKKIIARVKGAAA